MEELLSRAQSHKNAEDALNARKGVEDCPSEKKQKDQEKLDKANTSNKGKTNCMPIRERLGPRFPLGRCQGYSPLIAPIEQALSRYKMIMACKSQNTYPQMSKR